MSARILIVTNGPLARNPRVVKEATALGSAGYDVIVLGVRNHPSSEEVDREIMRTAPFRRVLIDMLSGYDAPVAVVTARRLRQRLMRDAAHRLGWKGIHSLGPASSLLHRASQIPADLTIVHNEIAHWTGVQLLNQGRRVAADIEDWHSEDLLPEDRIGRPLKLLRQTEQALLHRAAYATTTSHALADALHERYGGQRPAVISNSFDLPALSIRTQSRQQPPSLFWFSQTVGPGRGLELFFAAYARVATPSQLVLLGEARDDYRQHLLSLLPESHRERVSFLPLVSPEALPAVIAQHDIGLALEQSFIRNRDLTITNKILQYLGAGLAVVASDTAGQREVLAKNPQAGVLVPLSETTALAHTIEQLVSDPATLAARQAAARQLAAEHYNWELEQKKLVHLVAQTLVASA